MKEFLACAGCVIFLVAYIIGWWVGYDDGAEDAKTIFGHKEGK